MSVRTITRYGPGVSDGRLTPDSVSVYDWPGSSVPTNSRRPTTRSSMPQAESLEKKMESVQRPVIVSLLSLVTVQVTLTGSPGMALGGVTICVTFRSDGGGGSMTTG